MTTRRSFLAGVASAAAISPAQATPAAAPSPNVDLLAVAQRFDAAASCWKSAERALADAVGLMRTMVPPRPNGMYLVGSQSVICAGVWDFENDIDDEPIYPPNGPQRKVFSGPAIREVLARDPAPIGRFREQLEEKATLAEAYEAAVAQVRAVVDFDGLTRGAYLTKIDVARVAEEMVNIPAQSLPGLILKGRAVRALSPSDMSHAWVRKALAESLADDVIQMM